jgi:hypothetical protein
MKPALSPTKFSLPLHFRAYVARAFHLILVRCQCSLAGIIPPRHSFEKGIIPSAQASEQQ